jgi:hypothetical protein
MSHTIYAEARRYHVRLKVIFMNHRGGFANEATLRSVQKLCRAALLAVDDELCREYIYTVGKLAQHLFSDHEHQAWKIGALAGADHLRLKILKALVSFHSRIYYMQAMQRFAELQPYIDGRNDV